MLSRPGLCPEPHWGNSQRSPDPLAAWGAGSWQRREGNGKGEEGEGDKGREGRESMGTEGGGREEREGKERGLA